MKHIVLLFCWLCLAGISKATEQVQQLPTGFYRLAEAGNYKVFDSSENDYIYLDGTAVCTIADFKRIYLDADQSGQMVVGIVLTREGSEQLAAATAQLIGEKMAIVIDGALVSAPYVQSVISGGQLQISGLESVAAATKIKQDLERQLPARYRQTAAAYKAEAALLLACDQLDSAMVSRDTTLLEQLLHPLLTMGHSNGWQEEKENMLRSVGYGEAVYELIRAYGYTDVKIEKETASVRRQLQVKGRLKGHPYDIQLHVLEVWIKEKKQWQLFARQSVQAE